MVAGGEKIVEALSRDPKGLAQALFGKGLISNAVLDEMNELNETKTDKARRLYSAVIKVVKEYPRQYDYFIQIFKERPSRQYGTLLSFLNGLKGNSADIIFTNLHV